MLHMPKTDEFQTLITLQQLPVDLYLTGSRFFNPKCDADFDFFCQNTPEIQSLFKSLGYADITSRFYEGCCQVVKVYRKGKIDVQLVQNAILKQQIQQQLLSFYGTRFNNFPKSERKIYWRLAYAIAEAAKVIAPQTKSDCPF